MKNKQYTHKNPLRINFFEAIYGRISKYLTNHVFLFTSITPNQITLISGLFGIIGSILLFMNDPLYLVLAGIFLQLFCILDGVDGDVARAKKMQSLFGKWFDVFFDKLNDFLIILGLSVGQYWRTNDITFLYLGIILMGSVFFIQFFMLLGSLIMKELLAVGVQIPEIKDNKEVPLATKKKFLKSMWIFTGKHLLLEHCTFLFIVTVFVVLNEVDIGLWFLTIHALLTIIYILINNVVKLINH